MEKKMIALQVPEELYEKIRKAAFDNKVSVSKMIRIILEKYLREI